jgi:hypothetical protein
MSDTNPHPPPISQGGGTDHDYYGFTWGDVLFLALNVTGYTLTDQAIGSKIGRADDWILGERQSAWLLEQLSYSKQKWKLILIHHTVGGNAGDDLNTRYGRGGGRAARVAEQAQIHALMKQFGVQALFYGHDHVFTDEVVDGIHYVCAGSAGGALEVRPGGDRLHNLVDALRLHLCGCGRGQTEDCFC